MFRTVLLSSVQLRPRFPGPITPSRWPSLPSSNPYIELTFQDKWFHQHLFVYYFLRKLFLMMRKTSAYMSSLVLTIFFSGAFSHSSPADDILEVKNCIRSSANDFPLPWYLYQELFWISPVVEALLPQGRLLLPLSQFQRHPLYSSVFFIL